MLEDEEVNAADRNAGTESGLAATVYERLRRGILSGQLRPNQALVEADLAEQIGVSRMPVREGLVRLASEGLVRSQRRRWIVHEHTREEVRWIYEVRAALESEAAGLAAARATDEEVHSILETGQAHLFSKAPTQEARIDANEMFHGQVIAAAHNMRLIEMLRRNVTYFNVRFALFSFTEELEMSGEHHARLAKAIANRDSAAARSIGHEHVMHALNIIERAIS